MRITEQMAQKWLEQFEFPTDENSDDALATICEALQEYPKFKAIGTVEELQALKEKSVAKKPYEGRFGVLRCPICDEKVGQKVTKTLKEDCMNYCGYCGTRIDLE